MVSGAPSDSEKEASCRRIETITRGMVEGMNTRNFDPTSKAWSSTSIGFTSEVAFTTNPTRTNLQQYLTEIAFMTRDNPEMALHILTLDVNLDDSSHGHAFVNMEWHGFPKGFVRPCYAIYDFVRVQERWVCVKFRALPGIAAGSNTPQFLNDR